MSTSKTYQQSLADAGSENRPPMLERGSYIPWASRFRRYLNRKRDNRKWLLKALDEGPYEFKNFLPEGSTIPRLQTIENLEGDDLLLYDAEMCNTPKISVEKFWCFRSPPVRRALSSRLKLRHLRKVRFQRKDSDISSGIGLHVPMIYFSSLAESSMNFD
ncbi:hypothetical protein Tco_1408006 [Tanacetum coccineum]